MNALLILIPVSLVLVLVAVGAFWWAVRGGQFDDLEAPALAPLLDDPARGESPSQQDPP